MFSNTKSARRQRHRCSNPLAELTVAGNTTSSLVDFSDLIREEINVKTVTFSNDLDAFAARVLKPNGKVLGPRLGKAMQESLAAARAGDWSSNDDELSALGNTR